MTDASATQATALDIDCASCGATVQVEAELRTATCPYCDSPQVVQRPATADRPHPTFAVGFLLDRRRAEKDVRAWLRRRWLTPGSLHKAAVDHTRGIYLPAWLYGAVARAQWSADIGENYTETETYTTTDAQGKTVTRTRTVTRTEWYTLQGAFDGYVLDVVVTASKGVSNDELQAVEPFDLRQIARYSPALVSGWITEEPTLDRATCEELARKEGHDDVARRVRAFLPGDSQRNIQLSVQQADPVADLVLLPVWVFALRHKPDKPPVKLLVNGQSGKVAGKVPRSPWKIAAVVLASSGLVALIAGILTQC